MDSRKFINKVKYSPVLFCIFRVIGEFVLNIIKLFVKTDDNLILFVCFGGRKYDDSPRCIYEEMIKDDRFNKRKFIWAFFEPEKHCVEGNPMKIKIDTLQYYIFCLKSRVWITNSAVTRGLRIKGEKTFYYNTWHGSAIKKLGRDVNINLFAYSRTKYNKHNRNKTLDCMYDVFCAQSQYDIDIFSKCFEIPLDRFKLTGLPRNDELMYKNTSSYIERIKADLNIPKNRRIILYAPTYREFDRDTTNNCFLSPPMNLKKWEKELGDQYVLLFRAHYEVLKVMQFEENTFVRNMSAYPDLNNLILISDILLSDYSSIYFDFSITGRPMFCWAYDYEKYINIRGLYFDIRKMLGDEDVVSEDDVIKKVKNINMKERRESTKKFREAYVTCYGEASKCALNIIYDNCFK